MTEHQHDHHDHDDHDHEHHHHEHISYADAVTRFRADKDDYYRSGAHSPIPVEQPVMSTALDTSAIDSSSGSLAGRSA